MSVKVLSVIWVCFRPFLEAIASVTDMRGVQPTTEPVPHSGGAEHRFGPPACRMSSDL